MTSKLKYPFLCLGTSKVDIVKHMHKGCLHLFGLLDCSFHVFFLGSIALGIDQHKGLVAFFEHIEKHSVGFLQAVKYVNENHYKLIIQFRRILEVVLDETAPVHDLLLGSIGGKPVPGSIDKQGIEREFNLQKDQLFSLSWLLAGLYAVASYYFVDEGALSNIASSEKDKLLMLLSVRYYIFDAGPITNSVDILDNDLLRSSGGYHGAREERKEFSLSGIDLHHLL
jgi:hypothetical protein